MAFKFPLATVLRFRQSIEKREELALQRVLVELAQVQHRIDTLTADIARARQTLEHAMLQSLPAVDIESMTHQIDSAMERKQELLQSLAELHRRRETQLGKFHSAHNDRQMLSDMEDRQREAYGQERARAEQKFLDEIFASRTQRS